MSSLQDLQSRQRGEIKELTAKITALRKSIEKGAADKKKKQEINEEIVKMQLELKTKHEMELTAHQESIATNLNVSESQDLSGDNKKGNRQQKRREKKAMLMKQAYEEAKQEASQCINYKELEESEILNQLKSLNLRVKEIQPDGHCLYSAIAHQLGQDFTFKEIRSLAANYLRNHSSDFMPFIMGDSGEMPSMEEFMDYCQKVEFTAEWGGQIELQAISNSLKRAIHIVQMGSSMLKIGEEFNDKPPILLSYHRHAYGLGEHYNSLIE